MEGGLEFLVVRGFAVREGRASGLVGFEIRLATQSDEPLLYRRESCTAGNSIANWPRPRRPRSGEREARLRVENLQRALVIAQHRHRVPPSFVP
ncbi:hypothetical protein ACTMU2_37400 [Cupriavidus basilensis]